MFFNQQQAMRHKSLFTKCVKKIKLTFLRYLMILIDTYEKKAVIYAAYII